MKFPGDATDVVEVEAILLDTNTTAVHSAQVSKRLHDDHALAPSCRRQASSNPTGRAAIDTDVGQIDLGRTDLWQCRYQQQNSQKKTNTKRKT